MDSDPRQAIGRELQQLWNGFEIPVRVGGVHMAEIRRQFGQLALHIDPGRRHALESAMPHPGAPGSSYRRIAAQTEALSEPGVVRHYVSAPVAG